jgi:hypothetical protein
MAAKSVLSPDTEFADVTGIAGVVTLVAIR